MPTESDLISGSEQSAISEDKSVDVVDTFPMKPVKTVTIKKKKQNREIPLGVKIQQYADELYEQHGYGTEYEKSIFIVELAEKFPGLDDYLILISNHFLLAYLVFLLQKNRHPQYPLQQILHDTR